MRASAGFDRHEHGSSVRANAAQCGLVHRQFGSIQEPTCALRSPIALPALPRLLPQSPRRRRARGYVLGAGTPWQRLQCANSCAP